MFLTATFETATTSVISLAKLLACMMTWQELKPGPRRSPELERAGELARSCCPDAAFLLAH